MKDIKNIRNRGILHKEKRKDLFKLNSKKKRNIILNDKRNCFSENLLEYNIINNIKYDFNNLSSSQQIQYLKNLHILNEVLSKEGVTELVDKIIESNLIQFLLKNLVDVYDKKTKLEILFIFTNIAAENYNYTKILVDFGILPILINLLVLDCNEIKNQIFIIIRNILVDKIEYRNILIDLDIFEELKKCFYGNKTLDLNLNKNISKILVNLVLESKLEIERVVIINLLLDLYKINLDSIKLECLLGIEKILENSNYDINIRNLLVNTNFIKELLYSLKDSGKYLTINLKLRIIGYLVADDESIVDYVFNSNILNHFKNLLNCDEYLIRIEIGWILSNIILSKNIYLDLMIELDLIKDCLQLLFNDNFQVKKELIWIFVNILSKNEIKYTKYLIENNFIDILPELINFLDYDVIYLVLECIRNILKKIPNLIDKFESVGIPEKLELLQSSQNEEIINLSQVLIDKYFAHEY